MCDEPERRRVMGLDELSDAEHLELQTRLGKLEAAEGKRAGSKLLFGLIVEFMDKEGRIPTPIDDGLSGWFARQQLEAMGDIECLMQTRIVASGMWRWLLTSLRERQADEKGGAS
jgi:hypothetical protein